MNSEALSLPQPVSARRALRATPFPLTSPEPAAASHPAQVPLAEIPPEQRLPRHAAARYGRQPQELCPEDSAAAPSPQAEHTSAAAPPRRSRIRADTALGATRRVTDQPALLQALAELDAQFAAGNLEQAAYLRKKRFFLRQL